MTPMTLYFAAAFLMFFDMAAHIITDFDEHWDLERPVIALVLGGLIWAGMTP